MIKPFSKELYTQLGEFIDYMAEDNEDGTFKIIFKYAGYYDLDGVYHQEPSYIVIPNVLLDSEHNVIVKDGKLYTDHILQINENDEKNIFKGYGETVLYKVAFSDDDK